MIRTPVPRPVFAMIAGLLLLSSCSQYQKLLKSDDLELKYTRAVEYYEEGSYGKAIGLMDDIIPAFRGSARAENLNYYYAMAHYKQKDYLMASHYFRTFASGFPHSRHVEDFLFLSAYCKYLESPRPSLDQTSTREAIQELQAFINRFPGSQRVEEANQLIDELRYKLETKRFESAMLYLDLEDYTAAITTFDSFIKDYPDTEYREQALFNILYANFQFASLSIPQRQIERFRDVLEAYQRLVRLYPESQYLVQADRMRETAHSRIEVLQQSLQNDVSENQ